MTLTNWKNKGQYFDYKSQQIFTIDEGAGEDLLLIHGFPTASWDWWQMWEPLTARYRVLTLDMIGFGFSAKPKKYPYSIFDQADLIEDFLASKQVKKVKILSHDYGDTVAQELLARFHDRLKNAQNGVKIESLCLLNGGLFPEAHHPLFIQKILMSPVGSIIGRLFSRQKLGKNFKRIFGPNTQPTEKELDEFWHLISNNGGKYIFHLLIRYMQERKDNRARWVGALQQAHIPIRLIDGIFDPISGQQMANRYKEIIPNPDVIELKDIGHFPLIEAPKLVLKYYFEFLSAKR
jgi:pimeloyl-ACP methyl ester carboxylesterase